MPKKAKVTARFSKQSDLDLVRKAASKKQMQRDPKVSTYIRESVLAAAERDSEVLEEESHNKSGRR